jgi:hypothetical protein
MCYKHKTGTIYALSCIPLFGTEHRYQISESKTCQRELEKKDRKEEGDGENYTINIFRIGIFNKKYRDD